MAISGVNVASVFSGTDVASYATGSYTPTANRLLIAAVVNRSFDTATDADTPTLSGNGLTWSQVASYLMDASGTKYRVSVFVTKSGASPSAGAVTADFGGLNQGGCAIIVDEFDGADLSGTALAAIVQNKTGATSGSATSHTITLDAAIGSDNATYGTFAHETSELSTPGTGYTELKDDFVASGASLGVITEYKVAGSTTVDASWTTSIQHGGIALEIKAAAAAGGYPVVAATTGGANSTAVTSHVLNLPSGIVAGNLLIMVVGAVFDSFGWPAGWTSILAVGGGAGEQRLEARYRIADGTEGASITVTTGSARYIGYRSFRITGHHATSAPEAAGVVEAANNNPNPPTLDPAGWATEATLWLAATSYSANDSGSTDPRVISAYPTNYTNGTDDNVLNGVSTALGTARRENTVASEDPGTFTVTLSTGASTSGTIAIRPEGFVEKTASDTLSISITDSGSVSSQTPTAKAGSDTLSVAISDSGSVSISTPAGPRGPLLRPRIAPLSYTIDGLPVEVIAFSGTASAFGGFEQARGIMTEREARRLPLRIRQGSRLRVFTDANRKIWEGRLSAPVAIRGGLATFAAQGESVRAVKAEERLNFQSRDVSLFYPRKDPPTNGFGTDNVVLQISEGSILVSENVGAPNGGPGGADIGAVWWSPGSSVTRVAFDWRIRLPTSGWEIRVWKFPAPADTGHVLLDQAVLTTGSGSRDVFAIENPYDGILIQLAWLGGSANFGGNHIQIYNLRINGIAAGDTLYTSDVFKDVGARLGYDTTGVVNTRQNILPLDWTESHSALLSYGAMLEDRPWGVYDDDRLVFGEWGSKEWTVYQTDGATPDLTPMEVYNRAVCKYVDTGGAPREITLAADPDPLAGTEDPITNAFMIALADVQANSNLATAAVKKLLPYVSGPRDTGTLEIVHAYDSTGRDAPYEVRPGHTVRLADAGLAESRIYRAHEVTYSPLGSSVGTEAPASIEALLGAAALARARTPTVADLPEIEPIEAEAAETTALPTTAEQYAAREQYLRETTVRPGPTGGLFNENHGPGRHHGEFHKGRHRHLHSH